MKKLKREIITLSLATYALASSALTVTLTPGSLAGHMKKITDSSDPVLVLDGSADIRDLLRLQSLPAFVKTLDMKSLSIEQYVSNRPYYEGMTFFESDALPEYLLMESGLETVILPDAVAEIPEGFLASSSVKDVGFPASLLKIGERAFYGCAGLSGISFPASLQTIGEEAFARCISLGSVDLESTSVTEIGDRAFIGDRALRKVVLSEKLRTIGKEAFSSTSVENLDASMAAMLDPFSLSQMEQLAEVRINPAAEIGDGVFMGDSSLQTVEGMPARIPALAFALSPVLDVSPVLSASEVIGEYALARNNTSGLVFSENLSQVEKGAFYGMGNLEFIDATALGNRLPEADENSVNGIDPSSIRLRVDAEYETMWNLHPVWGRFMIEVSGVGSAETDACEIKVSARDGVIFIVSAEPMIRAEAYGSGGDIIAVATPGSTECRLETSGRGGNVIVVRVSTSAGTESFRIMMR